MRKIALRQSDSSSPESGFWRTNPSPNLRQKTGEAALVVLCGDVWTGIYRSLPDAMMEKSHDLVVTWHTLTAGVDLVREQLQRWSPHK